MSYLNPVGLALALSLALGPGTVLRGDDVSDAPQFARHDAPEVDSFHQAVNSQTWRS
jgi:hypothetical protein